MASSFLFLGATNGAAKIVESPGRQKGRSKSNRPTRRASSRGRDSFNGSSAPATRSSRPGRRELLPAAGLTRRAGFAFASFVYAQWAAAHVEAIHVLNGRLRIARR